MKDYLQETLEESITQRCVHVCKVYEHDQHYIRINPDIITESQNSLG